MSEEKKVMLVDITVSVTKETYELAKAPADIVKSILKKAADGLTVDEIASSLLENVKGVIAAADNAKMVKAEVSQQPGAFSRAIANPMSEVLDAAVEYSEAKDALKESATNEGAEEVAPPAPEAAPEAPPAS